MQTASYPRPKPFTSLRVRLFLTVVLSLLPVLVLMLTFSDQYRQQARAEAMDDLLRLTRLVADAQNETIQNTRSLLAILADSSLIRNAVTEVNLDTCRQRLSAIVNQYPGYVGLARGTGKGN